MHLKKHRSLLLLWAIATCMAAFAACNNTPQEEKQAEAEAVAAPAAGPYDWNQQVFCLNMLSNISAHWGKSPSLKDSTKWAVDSVLKDPTTQKYIGVWNLVWGPEVYVGPKGVPANTMFVAQQGSSNNYVVAIAGTDPASFVADIFEDLDVFSTKKWPTGKGNTGNLSKGTYDGFMILRNVLKDDLRGARDFLASRNVKDEGLNIYVTGHSLGGFLSPAYALYLSDTKNEPLVGVGKNSNIYCLAVAGASPGDSTFSAYYSSQLGNNTIRVWNTLDVVPHAYQPSMLAQISSLYLPQDTFPSSLSIVKFGDTISVSTQKILSTLESNAAKQQYYQLYPNTIIGFTSDLYAAPNASDFMSQMLAQHIPAYATFFGVDSFQVNVQRILNLPNPMFSQGFPQTGISNYDTTGKNFNNMNP